MFTNCVVDAERRAWGQAPRISHWVYETSPGQISGCDGQGRVVMAIAAGPLFGSRLAAAFGARCGAGLQLVPSPWTPRPGRAC